MGNEEGRIASFGDNISVVLTKPPQIMTRFTYMFSDWNVNAECICHTGNLLSHLCKLRYILFVYNWNTINVGQRLKKYKILLFSAQKQNYSNSSMTITD